MAQGEGEALDRLLGFAVWLGLIEEELRAHHPRPGAQSYPAFVAWLALNGSRADVALAFLANLAAWGENCGRVAEALRARYRAGDEAVAFSGSSPARPPISSGVRWPCSRQRGNPPGGPAAPPGFCRRTSSPSGT
jgi:TENA/THI-4/PQQC family